MLSNSDPKNQDQKDVFFDKLYKSFVIERVKAKRRINSNAGKRGDVSELIIRNYE
jgi:DNA adenine methylase